jgi:hypothetical protein
MPAITQIPAIFFIIVSPCLGAHMGTQSLTLVWLAGNLLVAVL